MALCSACGMNVLLLDVLQGSSPRCTTKIERRLALWLASHTVSAVGKLERGGGARKGLHNAVRCVKGMPHTSRLAVDSCSHATACSSTTCWPGTMGALHLYHTHGMVRSLLVRL